MVASKSKGGFPLSGDDKLSFHTPTGAVVFSFLSHTSYTLALSVSEAHLRTGYL